MRVEGDHVLLRQHLRQPDDLDARLAPGVVHERRHLRTDLRRVGRARAEHDLHAGLDVPDGAHEVQDPLLPGDAPDEEDDRDVRVHAEAAQRRGRVARAVLVGVDAVVDDAHPLGRDAVERLHVALHRLRHGDDAVGVGVGGALDPGGRVVGGAELLDLPRPVRLERVRGEHQLRAGERPREAAGEVRVPGVAVDDLGRVHRAGHGQVAHERVEQPRVAGVLRREAHRGRDAADAQVPVRLVLLAEAEHLHVVRAAVGARQLARQVLDVDARPAVDVRRVLVRELRDAHGGGGGWFRVECASDVSSRRSARRARVSGSTLREAWPMRAQGQ